MKEKKKQRSRLCLLWQIIISTTRKLRNARSDLSFGKWTALQAGPLSRSLLPSIGYIQNFSHQDLCPTQRRLPPRCINLLAQKLVTLKTSSITFHTQRCTGCTSPTVRELVPSQQELGDLLSIQLHPVADNHFLKSTATICGYSLCAEGSARLLQNWRLCHLQVTFKLATISDTEVPR